MIVKEKGEDSSCQRVWGKKKDGEDRAKVGEKEKKENQLKRLVYGGSTGNNYCTNKIALRIKYISDSLYTGKYRN